eukprot:356573-Chlamydomonas_euryale.AAC.3
MAVLTGSPQTSLSILLRIHRRMRWSVLDAQECVGCAGVFWMRWSVLDAQECVGCAQLRIQHLRRVVRAGRASTHTHPAVSTPTHPAFTPAHTCSYPHPTLASCCACRQSQHPHPPS